jgi:hypothetical protein
MPLSVFDEISVQQINQAKNQAKLFNDEDIVKYLPPSKKIHNYN